MPAPSFWFTDPARPTLAARALSPVSAVFAALTAVRLASGHPYKASVPVICVGNINVGGTGKTPTVIALVQRLQDWGLAPHVVSRGHGGRLAGPIRVDSAVHTAADTGDEPLLLAAFTPTWVAKNRAAGVKAAEAAGAGLILMDDGFQNPTVVKDLSLVVVDAARGFGNGRVMPAGPLREPAAVGLARAGLVLSIGTPPQQDRFRQDWGPLLGPIPHLSGQLDPLQTGMIWAGLPVLAFAGIGNPARFFATLRELGANVVHGEALEDHQPLTPTLMTRLETEAKAKRAQLVTTEKDAVRLPEAFRAKVLTLPVRLTIADWGPLDRALAGIGLRDLR